MPRGIYFRDDKEISRLRAHLKRIDSRIRFTVGDDAKRKHGSEHGMWKGDNVGYHALHQWVRLHKPPPDRCSQCKKVGKVQAANISKKYLRDFTDWEYLCSKCHTTKDGTVKNLTHRAKKGDVLSKETRKRMSISQKKRRAKTINITEETTPIIMS